MIRSSNRQRFRGAGWRRGGTRLRWQWALVVGVTASAPAPAAAADTSDPRAHSGAGRADPWWGRDKALHLGFSAGLAATGYGVSSIWLDPPWQRTSVGGAFALTLGAGKELADWAGYGDPSYKDMLYNVAGVALGVTLAYLVDLALGMGSEPERKEQSDLRRAGPLLAF